MNSKTFTAIIHKEEYMYVADTQKSAQLTKGKRLKKPFPI